MTQPLKVLAKKNTSLGNVPLFRLLNTINIEWIAPIASILYPTPLSKDFLNCKCLDDLDGEMVD